MAGAVSAGGHSGRRRGRFALASNSMAKRRKERGAAAVEFALCVPFLVLIVFGSIDFGLAVQARTSVGNAAREGVRVASLGAQKANIENAARNSLPANVNPAAATITIKCVKPDNVTLCNPNETWNPVNAGNTAVVTVSVNYTGITGMFPSLTNAPMQSTSSMRIEG